MPLFVGFFLGKIGRKVALTGVLASTIITFVAHSSGPVMIYLLEIIGFMTWPFRRNMRAVRWGLVFGIIGLHLVMKAPVWYIIARVSSITGGSGDHRSMLIDQAIKHFGEWWLLGTKYTAHWLPYILLADPNMVDMTNQYLYVGVQGGVLPMLLFIAIIAYSFRAIGRAIQATDKRSLSKRILLWSMGVALFGHAASFVSVAYFSQIEIFWYLLLAMISACEGIFNKGGETVKEANVLGQTV
jgi:hypothetical protein